MSIETVQTIQGRVMVVKFVDGRAINTFVDLVIPDQLESNNE
jgi:hypothetical protein